MSTSLEKASLLPDTSDAIDISVKGFHDNFFKLCRSAKDTVEKTLKDHGMQSMEDLLQSSLKELPKDKADAYKKVSDAVYVEEAHIQRNESK